MKLSHKFICFWLLELKNSHSVIQSSIKRSTKSSHMQRRKYRENEL